MFVRNAWYIAAWTKEVTRVGAFTRTLLGQPVVMFRRRDGTPVAMHDRCPHRFAPLSCGKVNGDTIQCAYHGMTFSDTGRCVSNPTQPDDKIPRAARVETYPVVERHNMIWIWLGDPDRADPEDIPDYYQYDHPDWASDGGHLLVNANYQLLTDNLLDLTHIAFVHADILGNPHVAKQSETQTDVGDRSVVERRIIRDGPAVPAWRLAFDDYDGNVDLWMDMYWEAGANMILDVGVTPTGKARDDGIAIFGLDCLTPETATSTHYFFGAAHKYRSQEPAVTAFWMKALEYAFNQDKAIVEAVQSRMQGEWDILKMNPVVNKADHAAIQARRIVQRLIDEEGQHAPHNDCPATTSPVIHAET